VPRPADRHVGHSRLPERFGDGLASFRWLDEAVVEEAGENVLLAVRGLQEECLLARVGEGVATSRTRLAL